MTIDRSALRRILHIDDPADWGCLLDLRDDGVYRQSVPVASLNMLTPGEEGAVFRGGGPGTCLLRLPCTLDELDQFIDGEGLRDPFISRRLRLLRVLGRAGLNGAGRDVLTHDLSVQGQTEAEVSLAAGKTYWRQVLQTHVARIDSAHGGSATALQAIDYLKRLGDRRLPPGGAVDVLTWLTDLDDRRQAKKKTVANALSSPFQKFAHVFFTPPASTVGSGPSDHACGRSRH